MEKYRKWHRGQSLLKLERPNMKLGTSKLGSPVGAVGLALRAVNEVKLDRARLLLGWVTRLTVSIGLWLWADQLRP